MPDYGDLVSAVVAQNPGMSRPEAADVVARRWPQVHDFWKASLATERVAALLQCRRETGTRTKSAEEQAHERACAAAIAELEKPEGASVSAQPDQPPTPPPRDAARAPEPSAAELWQQLIEQRYGTAEQPAPEASAPAEASATEATAPERPEPRPATYADAWQASVDRVAS